jgi:hypothetical protein
MMRNHFRLIAILILISTLLFVMGCGISAQSIIDKLVSPTPTNTSTPTPTSTGTATSTPLPPVDIIPCALHDLCPEVTSASSLSGQTVVFNSPVTISAPYNIPLFFGAMWTAIDENTLNANLAQIHFVFEVDGQSYSNDAAVNQGQVPDANDASTMRPAVFTGAVVSGWQLNVAHTITIGFTFDSAVNNDWTDFPAGPDVYTYNVIPADLPTGTPTPLPPPPPPPRPTAIPYTKTPSCPVNANIEVKNSTGGQITLYLNGPAKFTFYLGGGTTNINVCPGTYSYTAYGCGGASNTGTISSGETHEFYCR